MIRQKQKNIDFIDNQIKLCRTNEDLNLLLNKYPNYDPYYLWQVGFFDTRNQIIQLWDIFKKHASNHFISEFKKKGKYFSRLWEMLLGVSLLQNDIIPKSNASDEFPDFTICPNGKEIHIECVSIQNTKNHNDKNRVPEINGSITRDNVIDLPENEIKLRISNALTEKSIWLKDANRDKIKLKPYVIALDTSMFAHYQTDNGKLLYDILYGVGDYQL